MLTGWELERSDGSTEYLTGETTEEDHQQLERKNKTKKTRKPFIV